MKEAIQNSDHLAAKEALTIRQAEEKRHMEALALAAYAEDIWENSKGCAHPCHRAGWLVVHGHALTSTRGASILMNRKTRIGSGRHVKNIA